MEDSSFVSFRGRRVCFKNQELQCCEDLSVSLFAPSGMRRESDVSQSTVFKCSEIIRGVDLIPATPDDRREIIELACQRYTSLEPTARVSL